MIATDTARTAWIIGMTKVLMTVPEMGEAQAVARATELFAPFGHLHQHAVLRGLALGTLSAAAPEHGVALGGHPTSGLSWYRRQSAVSDDGFGVLVSESVEDRRFSVRVEDDVVLGCNTVRCYATEAEAFAAVPDVLAVARGTRAVMRRGAETSPYLAQVRAILALPPMGLDEEAVDALVNEHRVNVDASWQRGVSPQSTAAKLFAIHTDNDR